MHVVIMGCGRVGSTLARALERGGHSVAVIDQNPDAFRRLGPDFHGATVRGVGFDRTVLIEAGIERAGGFAAVSDGDNSNILSARVAREFFGVERVVARIYDPGRASLYERLGVPTVAAARWAADQMIERLTGTGPEPAWRDPTGTVALVCLPYHSAWLGLAVRDIATRLGAPVPVLGRGGTAITTDDTTVLQDQDRLYVMTTATDTVRARLAQPPD